MKRIKKFVALALAASMVFATASTAFASKNAQTITEPGVIASTENLYIPMYKENGKWKVDPMYSYIGIKNIKWNSVIADMSIKGVAGGKAGPKKISVDTTSKYAPYALILKQKGVIVPREDNDWKTPDIQIDFWVKGDRQRLLYTRHIVTLTFVERETPFELFRIGTANLLAQKADLFATTNSEKFYKFQNTAWRTIRVRLKPYLKNLKLVAIRKDGRKEVIRSTSGRSVLCAYNLKELKAIEIRYTINRTSTAWRQHDYYNYLKRDAEVPVTTGYLTLNIK
jgi:hypothetical protein